MVDARETAPRKAALEMFVDDSGKPIREAMTEGGKSAAIPGAPAALAHVARSYGALPLSVSLAPAIRYAADGFKVDPRFTRIATMREGRLRSNPDAARIFLEGKRVPQPGDLLRQPELAITLERLAIGGAAGFYTGSVARTLVDSVNSNGGFWQLSDLTDYRITERAPVRFQHRGATITAASAAIGRRHRAGAKPEYAGAVYFSEPRAPDSAHLVVESMRRAFQDRARYLGDPDFVPVPVERLISKEYAQSRAATIDPAAATRSDSLGKERLAHAGSPNTTHLSVIDAAGNRVAATLTINWLFGSGIVAGDTGVLLNNEMDDFTFDPEVPNSYRLHGGSANAVAPGKRPLSSMTPAFVEDAKGVLILGAPVGRAS